MITFANGMELKTIAVYGGSMLYQDSQRKTLEIVCAADVMTLDEAKALWTDVSVTREITVAEKAAGSDGEYTARSVHINFTLPVELKMTMQNGAEVIRLKLAQKSALETAQEKQAQDIRDNEAALCELAELIAGGENDG